MNARRLIAAALAAALCLTSLPAHAQDTRINRDAAAAVIFGLATLAIIASQTNKKDDDDDDDHGRKEEPRVVRRHEPPRVIEPARPRAGHRRPPLIVPAECARRVEYRGRMRTAFGAPCLRRAGVDVARLPERCARRVDVGRRDVTAFGAGCLNREGVSIR